MSRLSIAFLLVAAAGCRCGPGGTGSLKPDFDPTPKGLSFEACPTKDESGNPVKDVFPDEEKLTVNNLGKASGRLQLTFSGPGKDLFSIDPTRTPTELGPTSQAEVAVRFAPVARGDVTATLTVDDGDESTQPVNVALTGTGINLPAQPTIEVQVENKDALGQFTACDPQQVCLLNFPDTFYKESATLKVKVKNQGCPALKVTQMEIGPYAGQTGNNLAFFLDEPGVPPTAAVPMLLTTADGNSETTLVLRFTPEKDGVDTQRYGLLTIKTNDPRTPEYQIVLFGNASEPAIYAQPTFCDFSNPADLCGNANKVPNRARFEIKNGGNVAITVNEVKLEKNGSGGRFSIVPTANPLSKTIQPGAFEVLEVAHNDAPLYVTELLTVSAIAGGQSAGKAILTLAGGVKPCLSTEPADQLDFENPTEELTKKTVTIKNGQGCGDLIVNRVFVDQNPFFSVVDPLVPAGHKVIAGGTVTATVQYKKPVSGGTQTGILRIDTNDPDYGPPPYKVVRLYSTSPLDQLPVAVLKGCLPTETSCSANGSQGSMSISLSQIAGTPKQLVMFGKDSYDPGNTSATPISGYLFRLVTKPTNATSATLESDGQRTSKDSVMLTLDNNATGLYRVTLTVYDDKGQPSPAAAELRITVNQ